MKICVFLGAESGVNDSYLATTKILAEEITKRKMTLVYGGATQGLMGLLADTILSTAGCVIGVMPKEGLAQEIAHPTLTDLIFVSDFEARKKTMVEMSDVFLALPGGLGTFEEIFKIWNAIKVGLIKKPLYVLNINGYYDFLYHLINNAIVEGFLKKEYESLITISDDIFSIFEKIDQVRLE